jgi:hypothetical protein
MAQSQYQRPSIFHLLLWQKHQLEYRAGKSINKSRPLVETHNDSLRENSCRGSRAGVTRECFYWNENVVQPLGLDPLITGNARQSVSTVGDSLLKCMN